jgi:hypothetical protein
MLDKVYNCYYKDCGFTSASRDAVRVHIAEVAHSTVLQLNANRETRLKNLKLRQEQEKENATAEPQDEGSKAQIEENDYFAKRHDDMRSGENSEADNAPPQRVLLTRPHVRAATPSVAYEADDEGHDNLKPTIPVQAPNTVLPRPKRKAFPKELRHTGPVQRDMLGRIIHPTPAVAQLVLNIPPPEPPFVLIPIRPGLVPQIRTTTNPLASPPSTKIAIPSHFLHPHSLMGPNIVGPQPWQKRHTHKSLLEQHLRPKDIHHSQNWDRPFVPIGDNNQARVNACEDGNQSEETVVRSDQQGYKSIFGPY